MKELSRKPISAGEVKEILKKLDEDSTDQIQRRTLEYVNKFTTANPKKVNKTVTSLMKVEELTQEQCYELIDINPQTCEGFQFECPHRTSWRGCLCRLPLA